MRRSLQRPLWFGLRIEEESRMKIHSFGARDWGKAIAIGIAVSFLTAAFMIATMRAGVSPMPKSLGLAFAEAILARTLPLPVGLLFHTVWVTAFSVLYIAAFRDALTFIRAFWLAAALWLLVLVFFYPFVGWGFLGYDVGPKLIFGAAIPHLLFAIFLWSLSRWSFRGAGLAYS
jgi:hypothetical protein